MKHQSVYNRLRKIEGQVRGIEDMIAKEKDDREIIIQLSAVKSAVRSCLVEMVKDMTTQDENKISLDKEAVDTILRLLD